MMVSSWFGADASAQSGKNSTVLDVLIAFVAGMKHLQFLWCSGALLINPSVPQLSHHPLSTDWTCATNLVPAIEIGCFMKLQCPCKMVHAEIFLFVLDGLSKCGGRRSH